MHLCVKSNLVCRRKINKYDWFKCALLTYTPRKHSVSENKVDPSPSAFVNTIVADLSGIYLTSQSYSRFAVVFTDMKFRIFEAL